MTRQRRADSIAEQVRAMQAKQIVPPDHVPLGPDDMPFFDNIIDQFARSEWTPHQVEVAALLARTMSDMNEAQKTLRNEAPKVDNGRGGEVANPLIGIIRGYTSDIGAMRRSLGLHARARNGDNRSVATRNQVLKSAQDALDDDLLARPN